MKTSRSTNNRQSKQGISKKPRPEIRDDLDSRKEKEAGYRGDISKKGARKKKNFKKISPQEPVLLQKTKAW
ncbi:MAG: hypothetical protein HYU69_01265 [Bacteroidetes bacterium]|nr:hypothetical protein [Bacteroidota bacterium]